MNNDNEFYELNIADLFRYLIKRIKISLIGALVVSVLFGIFYFIKISSVANLEEKLLSLEVYMVACDERIDLLEKTNIKNAQKIIEYADYKDNSIVYSLDPENVCMTNIYYYIDTFYEINPLLNYQNPDRTGIVGNLYSSYMNSNEAYSIYGKDLGIDIEYVKELMGFSYSNGVLTLTIYAPDESFSAKVLDSVDNYLKSVTEEIDKTVTNHDIRMIKKQQVFGKSDYVANRINTKVSEINGYSASIENNNELILEVKGQKAEYENEYNDLNRSNPVSFLKYLIIGLAVGFVLANLGLGAFFIFCGKLSSSNDFKSRYEAEVISSLAKKDNDDSIEIVDCCKLALSNISLNILKPYKILVLGDSTYKSVNDFLVVFKAIYPGINFVGGTSICSDYESIIHMRDCDYIIDIVETGKSKHSQISAEIEKATKNNKKIGFIVVE